ncbi:MAG: LysM peptidoglycan-binding domain-containing protein [Chloroflexi bacterium]|nr:LysM peptidoglycan-binding domain-containing protein [Chloroflexota bacterium]
MKKLERISKYQTLDKLGCALDQAVETETHKQLPEPILARVWLVGTLCGLVVFIILSKLALSDSVTSIVSMSTAPLVPTIIGSIVPVITPTSTPTPNTPTLVAKDENIIHTVAFGQTLEDIAVHYGTSVKAIKSANSLTFDFVQQGNTLVIPLGGSVTDSQITETTSQTWQFSVIEGDLKASYPLAVRMDRFTLYHQPSYLTDRNLGLVLKMVSTALSHIENTLDVHLDGRFNAYAAGSLFRPPDLALRGRSFSSQRRFFFLHDGTGSLVDQQYNLTHELAHVMTWNTMGEPSSVMLHEGVAVYLGIELVKDAGYLPLDSFCAAHHSAGQLSRVSTDLSFKGHIRDLDNYYAAGCFVQFLIEKYRVENFASIYHTGDYYGVYGKSLADLEAEWIANIEAADYAIPFDIDEFVYYVDQVSVAYGRLFSSFDGTENQIVAYQELDRARMAFLQGRLNEVACHLLKFESILNQKLDRPDDISR